MDHTTDDNTPTPPTALQATLTVASSAANLVLRPYVVAGRVAYQATSFAVTAPIKVTKHVANSITGAWQPPPANGTTEDAAAYDLFGEREHTKQVLPQPVVTTSSSTDSEEDDDATRPIVQGVLFESDVPVEEDTAAAAQPTHASSTSPGVVSQLIFLPVRLVSSGVSTAAALPASAISLGGRTISKTVSSSQALASSALVASGGLVLRTSRHVASGVTGLVGSSVKSVSYVIPPSVSNALWHGMNKTGNMSTSVIAYAIAVPSFRMAQALVPSIDEYVSEQQCVDLSKDGVKMLVKVLGPQNAFYVLKWLYETVNSDEVYDAFLLCHDLVRESLDKENYKAAGASISQATGVETVIPVVKEIYKLLPSVDEMVDAALFCGELADEILGNAMTEDSSDLDVEDRFELLSSDDDEGTIHEDEKTSVAFIGESDVDTCASTDDVISDLADTSSVDETVTFEPRTSPPTEPVVSDEPVEDEQLPAFDDDAWSFAPSFSQPPYSSPPTTSIGGDLFSSSVAFFGSILDSDEAASLLNTFGDFVDLLVE